MSLTPDMQVHEFIYHALPNEMTGRTMDALVAWQGISRERQRYLGALQAILASSPNEAHAIARIALDEGDLKPYF